MPAASVKISLNFPPLILPAFHKPDSTKNRNAWFVKYPKPISFYRRSRTKVGSFRGVGYRAEDSRGGYGLSFPGVGRGKNGILPRRRRRVVVVKSDNGGGKVNTETQRVLGNLALAILLTYLTMTDQLGWLFDAIVSIWLLAVIVPIVSIGAFIWWVRRDIVQSSCPNCRNEFQVFKSTLNDEVQLCPFCTQPFSVGGDKFVRDPVTFSNQATTTFDQLFGKFSPQSKKGKQSSGYIVDVEAEIRDAD